ncbi:MAG: hypothetical protein U0892_21310 [Pirellulales bacterium]
MSSFREEDLISYLLGDADEALCRQIEAAIAVDASLRARLTELRGMLGELDAYAAEAIDPPAGLVERTLSYIDAAFTEGTVDERREQDAVRLQSSSLGGEGRGRRSGWDMAVLSVSVLVLCSLLLPTVLRARFESRRAQCAYNLCELGRGLVSLATADKQQRFPAIPTEGPLSFAGYYAMRMQDVQLLGSPAQLNCPSVKNVGLEPLKEVPTEAIFLTANDAQQAAWRKTIGGDYAYNLGVIEEGEAMAPKLSGRSYFAILGDSPERVPGKQMLIAHEGRGINIFYEDGHVRFINLGISDVSDLLDDGSRSSGTVKPVLPVRREQAVWQDHPYLNYDGKPAVGLFPNDATLGPSSAPPTLR